MEALVHNEIEDDLMDYILQNEDTCSKLIQKIILFFIIEL